MFKRGDIVEILEEFQDPGDSTFTWVVLHDEEKGRVDITPKGGDLLLVGFCSECRGDVARVIEMG